MGSNQGDACPLPPRDNDSRLMELLKPCTVAVVGMSPKTERPSNEVGLFLHARGFDVIPVHPKAAEISGLKAYPSLKAIPKERNIEMVDLFVAGERTMEVVEQAAEIGAKLIWFQPGSENAESEKKATELGLEVISGRCTMAEIKRLFNV